MGSNSAFCIKDKYKFDQLSRMAKAQNKQKWLQDVKADEEKCAKVPRKYAELTGDDGSGSKRKAHFSQVVASHCDIEDDAQQMAANMVRKSGGSAFQGQTMDVNLDELVPSVEEPS